MTTREETAPVLESPSGLPVARRSAVGRARARRWWLLLACMLLLALLAPLAPAMAAPAGFDHDASSFPLRGRHEDVGCEACHLRGIFKGTPRDCATCHEQNNPRGALAMPTRHVQTIDACDTCHSTAGFSGARFSHVGVMPGGCASCHDGIRAPGKPVVHPATNASCDQCHRLSGFLPVGNVPANHIPYAANATCTACHTSADFSVMPTLTAIHANAPSTTGNCAQCHGSAAPSFAIPAANFSIVGLPGDHLPTSASCETCHVGAGSSIAAAPVVDGASFGGSLMNHAGISGNCVACHAVFGSPANFAGIGSIVKQPATSPVGPGAHIPSGTACEACHLASMPSGLIPASATKIAPGTAFATPAPGSAQIHTGITSGCAACHETSYTWMGVGAYPIAPTTLTPGAQYTGFQTRPQPAGGSNNVADPAHPTSGDCSLCHVGTTAFIGVEKPTNHIPYASGASCNDCHTGTDYSVMPTLAAIHANAPSTTSNCAQCHGSAAASFAIPAANFSIVGLPSNHLPTSASCETCHVGAGSSITSLPVGNGAKFSGSLMSHAGITNNCSACHVPAGTATNFVGVSAIVGMPRDEPDGQQRAHPVRHDLRDLPPGEPADRADPGVGRQDRARHGVRDPRARQRTDPHRNHLGLHELPRGQLRMDGRRRLPDLADHAHIRCTVHGLPDPAAHGRRHLQRRRRRAPDDRRLRAVPRQHQRLHRRRQAGQPHPHQCERDLQRLPHRHRLLGDADAGGDPRECAEHDEQLRAVPRRERRHRSRSPQPTSAIVGLPSNHLPTSASCETCHVGAGSSITSLPVGNGAKFSGSLMSHAGHRKQLRGLPRARGHGDELRRHRRASSGMPPTSPTGAGSHIPSGTTCETCHLASAAHRPRPGLGDQDRARHGLRDPRARQRADPHRRHLGLHELPRGQLRVDGRGRLPDLAELR